ncbi:MAG: NYN domain-containing protein, partial [Anaerolineales bacterium]
MPNRRSNFMVGVFVDVANLARNGGYGMRYDVLREFACRGEAEPMRLNAYVSYDAERSEADSLYRDGQYRFFSMLRDFGYKVIQKNVKWYTDESGNRFGKANADLDLAVDALLQSENLDRLLLATGDGDFVQVVRAVQNKGCRVEVVAFDNVSADLRREADLFVPGYL